LSISLVEEEEEEGGMEEGAGFRTEVEVQVLGFEVVGGTGGRKGAGVDGVGVGIGVSVGSVSGVESEEVGSSATSTSLVVTPSDAKVDGSFEEAKCRDERDCFEFIGTPVREGGAGRFNACRGWTGEAEGTSCEVLEGGFGGREPDTRAWYAISFSFSGEGMMIGSSLLTSG
jgi:hypothetical protein